MKKINVFVFILISSIQSFATEGMWIPTLLDVVYDDMKGMGLKISQEDLYAINNSSLKDAIVLFGGGCTAEVVSNEGLIFTNHHCGYDYIQYHSSLTNDYLTNGFWAMNRKEELKCQGLTATFILQMEDVTTAMLEGITSATIAEEVAKIKAANKKKIEEELDKSNGLGGYVRAFNYGTQYFLIVTQTFSDIRLVGAPPSAIGKFGGDTDNWVWPRHTGDFSVFRIYANNDNQPAAISDSNRPFQPRTSLSISLEGVHEGDFSMVYGFPGRTDHFLTSYAVDYVVNYSNPMKIHMRTTSLDILDVRMKSSDKIRIQYAAKQSGISNAWKKWKGQNMGLKKYDAVAIKKKEESQFMGALVERGSRTDAGLLSEIEQLYKTHYATNIAREAFVEYVYYGPEIFAFAHETYDAVSNMEKLKADNKWNDKVKELEAAAMLFYKDFDLTTEKMLFAKLTPLYKQYVESDLGPFVFDTYIYKKKGGDIWEQTANNIYDKSIFSDSTKYFNFLRTMGEKPYKKLAKDNVYLLSVMLFDVYNVNVKPKAAEFATNLEYLMNRYLTLQMKMGNGGKEWADANSTLRISYGKVEGSAPHDGMTYTYYTTTDGILAKNAENNPDFVITDRMKMLLEKREFGGYAEGGELRVAYTGSNHTTGGNSGSPALNANGHLVGINFDRSWESTMSDIYYNPEICRNIMVDIRYVLWVIDVYANADYLLDEMKLVGKKKPEPVETK